MSFFSRLFNRKGTAQPVHAATSGVKLTDGTPKPAAQATAKAAPAPVIPKPAPKAPNGDPLAEAVVGTPQTTELLRGIADRLQQDAQRPDIWDMEEEGETERTSTVPPSPMAPTTAELLARAGGGAAKPRTARTKTRLIGFDTSEGDALDLADDMAPAASDIDADTAPAAATGDMVHFPVGWVVVTDGPGRGAHFPLVEGLSSVGRGDDQTVRLDFGDASISRTGHAAITFEADTRSFGLAQGGKSNIIRLNGQPVLERQEMQDGDRIRLGETELRLVVLCNETFDWTGESGDEEDDDDLAIA
ncbi:MAG: FHA domain-containing protein [Pseudomonadota bacterium]